MNEFRVESADLKKLIKAFHQLEDADQHIILDKAFEKAIEPTVALAKLGAGRRTGNLISSIGSSPLKGETGVRAGARQTKGYRGYHGHLVEDGTKSRSYVASKRAVFYSKKTGKWITIKPGREVRTGWMVGKHFMVNAAKATESNAMKILGNAFYEEIGKHMRENGLR